jgi:hypothetical protein
MSPVLSLGSDFLSVSGELVGGAGKRTFVELDEFRENPVYRTS